MSVESTGKTAERPAKAIYYEVALRAFDGQMQQIDQLDGKASGTFTAASGILAIIAGLLALAAPSKGSVTALSLAVFLAGLVAYVATAAFLLSAFRIRAWNFGPELESVARETGLRDVDVIQDWVADSYVEAVGLNRRDVNQKSQLINYGLYGLLGESVVLALAIGSILFVR
jgi:hypothetical protein